MGERKWKDLCEFSPSNVRVRAGGEFIQGKSRFPRAGRTIKTQACFSPLSGRKYYVVCVYSPNNKLELIINKNLSERIKKEGKK